MFSQFFKKLSLTQQVLLMILLFISFFATFFFFYLSNNIDNMIANQMYTTMSSRQQPIVSLLKSNLLGAGDAYDAIYKALSSDNNNKPTVLFPKTAKATKCRSRF